MCGIVGYIGNAEASDVLLDGLKKLEYRGYDSAGIAVRQGGGEINIIKTEGKLENLIKEVKACKTLKGNCGIGHTRWATHGEPTEVNAHPHLSDGGNTVVVHNGIIENYAELREKLIGHGYTFYSQTDTEVATKLIDYYYRKYGGALEAMEHFILRACGSYAIAVMFSDRPDTVYATRKDSPMIIGVNENGTFLASDAPAILKHTHNVYYIENCEIAELKCGSVRFFNVDRVEIEKSLNVITWNAEAAERGGFEHFMMKEIHEQPSVISDTLNYILRNGKLDFSETGLTDKEIKAVKHITVVACGSAYHAGVVMQYVTENLAKIPVRVEIASEFRYRNPVLGKGELVVVVSQSGETADSLAALREAKRLGAATLAVVNVLGSSIAREADRVFYTKAGPEISVATTKAYSSQLIAGYLLAVKIAQVKGVINGKEVAQIINAIKKLPSQVQSLLEKKEEIQRFSAKMTGTDDVFFIGRGVDYAVSLEGSLKLKEISYIHSEAYAAGELKHGTISLIEKGTLVCGVITQENLAEKTISNMVEVKSRGAKILAVVSEKLVDKVSNTADVVFTVPDTDPFVTASLAVIPLQLLSYYVSANKGLDVDKPRNLAKSVTVE